MAYRGAHFLCTYGREIQHTVSLQKSTASSGVHSWASPALGVAISSWLQKGASQQFEQPFQLHPLAQSFASGSNVPDSVSPLLADITSILQMYVSHTANVMDLVPAQAASAVPLA